MSRTDLELKRAERYAIFLSLVVLDLSFLSEKLDSGASELVDAVCESVREKIREIDAVGRLGPLKIGLLLPETPRQGAEMVGRRVGEQIRDIMTTRQYDVAGQTIPVEMASYPDAAGNRTIPQFLEDLAKLSDN
ncbi:MAG: hypothetical protein KOO62_06995 [candidate division Zixibacteria bacterium]|nr:hypothetical protein [candidate division Zixibacteria bacterium]